MFNYAFEMLSFSGMGVQFVWSYCSDLSVIITIESIAGHGAKIMSDMYQIPADTAVNFMIEQVKVLY